MKIKKEIFIKLVDKLGEVNTQLTQLDAMGIDLYSSILIESYKTITNLLLETAFGKNAYNAVSVFVNTDSASPFKTIDELYDFVSDEYVEYISDDALPIDVLIKKLDNSPMIQSFHKFITDFYDSKSQDSEGK